MTSEVSTKHEVKHLSRSHTIVLNGSPEKVFASEAGNVYLEAFSEENYRQMIDSWQININTYLESNRA
jgi:hypothetical protein